MRELISLMLALLVLLIPPARAAGNSFAIRDVRLFDGTRIIPRATVIVRDGIVVRVARDARIPAELEVIDGKGRTLLPGLIDSHVHIFPGAQADALRFGAATELDMFTLRPDFPRWRTQRQSLNRTAEADTWSARARRIRAGRPSQRHHARQRGHRHARGPQPGRRLCGCPDRGRIGLCEDHPRGQ